MIPGSVIYNKERKKPKNRKEAFDYNDTVAYR